MHRRLRNRRVGLWSGSSVLVLAMAASSAAAAQDIDLRSLDPGAQETTGPLPENAQVWLGSAWLTSVYPEGESFAFSGTIESDIWSYESGYGRFIKAGAGDMVIDNSTMDRGEGYIFAGSMTQSSGETAWSNLAVGSGAGADGTLYVTGGEFDVNVGLRVGDFGGTGLVQQTGGTVRLSPTCDDDDRCPYLNIGNQGGTGTYTITGGELLMTGGSHTVGRNAGNNAKSTGVLNIGGTALVELTGTGSTSFMVIGDRDAGAQPDSDGTVNQTGGILRIDGQSQLYLGGFGAGVYNLDGGALEIGGNSLNGLYTGSDGSYAFNLGGGTVKVIGSDLDTLVDAELQAGTTSTIDTNGFDALWRGALTGAGALRKTGDGELRLGNAGNAYTGGTVLEDGVLSALTAGAFVDDTAYTINGGLLDVASNGELAMSLLYGTGGAIDMGGGSSTILTVGAGSYAGSLQGGGGLAKTGSGTLILTGNSENFTGETWLSEGELALGHELALGTGNLLMADGTTLTFINGVEAIGNSILLDGEITFDSTFGEHTELTGGFGGEGELEKTGMGTLLLGTNSSPQTYEVDLANVEGGTLLVGNDVTLQALNGVFVEPGGTFGGNGTVEGDVFNAGVLSPGQSVGIFDIDGNYAAGPNIGDDLGAGRFEVDLAASSPVAGTDYDRLRISGEASGQTTIYLYRPNSGGAPTTPAGGGSTIGDLEDIRLVEIGDNQGSFVLGNRVVQGGHEIELVTATSTDFDGTFFAGNGVDDPITYVGLAQGEIAAELFGYAGATQAARQVGTAMIGNYVERRGLDGLIGEAPVDRAWARVVGAGTDGGDGGLDHTLWLGQGGIDLFGTETGFRTGVMAGYGRLDGDVATNVGRADLTGDVGMVGLYANWSDGGSYAEAVAQYGFGHWEMTPGGIGRSRFDTDSYALSVEAGTSIAMSQTVSLVPWAQLAFQSIEFGRVRDPYDLDADFEDTDSLVARAGARAVLAMDGVRLHGGVAVAGELMGEGGAVVQGLRMDADADTAWIEVSAGGEVSLGQGAALFGQASYDHGLDGGSSTFRGHGGVRLRW